jgi:hypothetical protein
MTKKLPKDIAAFFQESGRRGGKIGGKRSLETMTPAERSDRAKKAAAVSAEARRKGAQRLPAVDRNLEAPRSPTPKSQALILADQILNALDGYARKGSRTRKDFYRRELNWIADVLMRVEAGERDPLRLSGQ